MMDILIAWLAAGLAFGVADAIYLSQAVPKIYRPLIGEMLSGKTNVGAAAAFYVIYISGIIFFAVEPALAASDFGTATFRGAVLGFVAFATYDLTNHATLKVWHVRMSVIDMAWGTFATGLAASAGYAAAAQFG